MSALNPKSSAVQIPAGVNMIDVKSLGEDWKVIGEGGFGKVYKAKHDHWRFDVAVKLLGSDDGTISDQILVEEAELMQRAANPYVVKVHGMFKGITPNGVFMEMGIVMELMENGSLASLQGKLEDLLPWPLAFRLAHQVALGMNYLHSLDPCLLHKDLKPANILLDAGLGVKITDFGLARFANKKTEKHLEGACTWFYAPPEAFDGLKGGATPAFDVYSYGVMLWSILNTGQRYGNMSFKPLRGERPPLEHINGLQAAGLGELVNLMKRCWSQKKEDRPSFRECTVVTGPLYEMYMPEIPLAVCQVQMELMKLVQEKRDQMKLVQVQMEQMKPVPAKRPVPAPVPVGSTNREDFLKHACSLSLDPSSVKGEGLSEDNRKVTATEDQQVSSSERLPERGYFEVKWSERHVAISVINRKEKAQSGSGNKNDKSWMLHRSAGKYWVKHDGIKTEVFPTEVASSVSGDNDAEGVYGVYVGHTAGSVSKVKGHTAGSVSFYSVSGDRMKLLHTVQTDATQPLYAGIFVPDYGTAEVCKIW